MKRMLIFMGVLMLFVSPVEVFSSDVSGLRGSSQSTADAIIVADDVSSFMAFFYQRPDPYKALLYFSSIDRMIVNSSEESMKSVEGFYAALFYFYPKLSDGFLFSLAPTSLLEIVNQASPLGRKILYRALWDAFPGHRFLYERQKVESPEMQEWLLRLFKSSRSTFLQAPAVNSVGDLDLMWGAFMESGQTKYIQPILESVIKFDDKANKEKVLIGYCSLWSLCSNAQGHPGVLVYLEEQEKKSTGNLASYLSKLITKAKAKEHYFTKENLENSNGANQ